MKDFWNKRYAESSHVYGTEGNEFLKLMLEALEPGKILLPADGQGRNACMAAKMGWDVHAFDFSESGQKSALEFAERQNLSVRFECCSAEDFEAKLESFDAVALIFAHLPNRSSFHHKMMRYLKPGGVLILEAFSKNQLGKASGGPQSADMLFSAEELMTDFAELTKIELTELNTVLREGIYHDGEASVIRVKAHK